MSMEPNTWNTWNPIHGKTCHVKFIVGPFIKFFMADYILVCSCIVDHTCNIHETILQDFPVILKGMLQNYWKIFKKCLLVIGCRLGVRNR